MGLGKILTVGLKKNLCVTKKIAKGTNPQTLSIARDSFVPSISQTTKKQDFLWTIFLKV